MTEILFRTLPRGGELGEALLRDLSVPRRTSGFVLEDADGETLAAYHALRREQFVEEQGLFEGSDLDEVDEDPRTVVLVARTADGTVLGGVRLGPVGDQPDVGWWQGGRLVGRGNLGAGPALVRAACARAEAEGVLRFDATVQPRYRPFFAKLGWDHVRAIEVAGAPHELMRWPVHRIQTLTEATKRDLGVLLHDFTHDQKGLGGAGFIGDDGAPVPGSDLVAACDAILPSMVERDPDWAGWCSVLVNLNDLAAMGATPVALLDSVGARDSSFAARVLGGLRRAGQAYGVPVIGGHTQFGVPASLSVTALGRTDSPVPGGGGRSGDRIRLTADLEGGWRPGYSGRQWDSTSHRTTTELRSMLSMVGRSLPRAAKDVSMAGIAGTLGMLAEAGGCGAVLDVADVPRPGSATTGDWLTCFPGFGMITAEEPGSGEPWAGPAVSAVCGELVEGAGVQLRWPDGDITQAVPGAVTGLGSA
ncbi:GNAT family N-acetyltransferase [Kineosporia mesophila]|uniref:GNAT family N-acetyltransferase n=1 Tax=Kineosporia mesophila TaxID=566012 RepID=A0ABP7AFJ7_9ACTN|nr:MSMEG_0567/sll0787 family protein [Kineosporia mesophila]MCD5354352.1 AIR synthase related protein [Kineosporia mesophila]